MTSAGSNNCNNEGAVVGRRFPSVDARAKVTGEGKYTADIRLPGMCYGAVLRSQHAFANLVSIDKSPAEGMDGVIAVLTADDVPGRNGFGILFPDQPVLVKEKVRFLGDAVALVIAEDRVAAQKACHEVRIVYEPLCGVFDPFAAMDSGAPMIHPSGNVVSQVRIEKGSVEKAFQQSDVVCEATYQTPFVDHAALEPEAALATFEGDGTLCVWVGSQSPFHDREEIAQVIGLSVENVRVINPLVGGSFGRKEDIGLQILAALGSYMTRKPVMLVNSREESIRYHTKRHAITLRYRTGVNSEGEVLAQEISIWADTGAYACLGPAVISNCAQSAIGPYEVPNVLVEGFCVFTNNPPASAMRGFGGTQAAFGYESQMDLVATELNIDPLELRKRNALRRGSIFVTGVKFEHEPGIRATIDQAAEAAGPQPTRIVSRDSSLRRGRGVASVLQTIGLGKGIQDKSQVILTFREDGTAVVETAVSELGQGIHTVLAQLAAEELHLDYDSVLISHTDTATGLDAGVTNASHQTFLSGSAVLDGARKLRELVLDEAELFLKIPRGQLAMGGGSVWNTKALEERVVVGDLVRRAKVQGRDIKAIGSFDFPYPPVDCPIGPDFSYKSIMCFGTQIVDVIVDIKTGRVTVEKVISAHNVGRAINRNGIEGQIEGGCIMGMGYALTERLILEQGKVLTCTFTDYLIPTAADAPPVIPVIIEIPEPSGPMGATGVGEIPVNGMAPAIGNAIADAIGVHLHSLPFTPERVLAALESLGRKEH